MRNLKDILESIFDIDNNIDNVDESVKYQIKQFIEDNYNKCDFFISKDTNEYGKYEVACAGSVSVKNKKITSLTNGLFIWDVVDSTFDCNDCELLKSLDGAPKSVNGGFCCSNCKSLKTLEGAPEKVGGYFSCSNCKSLKTLEGAPKEVGWNFSCSGCNSLTSLKGAPEKVGGDFYSLYCGKQFTEEDVKKVSNVKLNICCK